MTISYRILTLQRVEVEDAPPGDKREVPGLPGLSVTEQTPETFTASGDVIPAPPEAGNQWTREHKANLTRIPGTDDYVVFAEDFSEIDASNKGKTLLQYGRSNWPWWSCDVVVESIKGTPVVSKVPVVLGTVPAKDASEEEPWTVNGKDASRAVHSLPSQSVEGVIAMIEQDAIK